MKYIASNNISYTLLKNIIYKEHYSLNQLSPNIKSWLVSMKSHLIPSYHLGGYNGYHLYYKWRLIRRRDPGTAPCGTL